MTEYRVVFQGGEPRTATIRADKVNLGLKRLWFYDEQNHLIAMYRWEELVGFEVVGSAEGQVLVDELLHERRIGVRNEDREQAIEERGKMTVLLEECLATLKRADSEIRDQWIAISDENKKKTQVQLLVNHQAARLQTIQAGLIDTSRSLQRVLEFVQQEFEQMGLPAPTAPSKAPVPNVLKESEETGDKRKRWFT
ncbi:MAG TPA: hypothetical protein VKX25_14870 [Bryobacteraceae bacterium]|jgi:hypothetical protein|nr:hypothetical protein [Bryobacteraceae bacterium]